MRQSCTIKVITWWLHPVKLDVLLTQGCLHSSVYHITSTIYPIQQRGQTESSTAWILFLPIKIAGRISSQYYQSSCISMAANFNEVPCHSTSWVNPFRLPMDRIVSNAPIHSAAVCSQRGPTSHRMSLAGSIGVIPLDGRSAGLLLNLACIHNSCPTSLYNSMTQFCMNYLHSMCEVIE